MKQQHDRVSSRVLMKLQYEHSHVLLPAYKIHSPVHTDASLWHTVSMLLVIPHGASAEQMLVSDKSQLKVLLHWTGSAGFITGTSVWMLHFKVILNFILLSCKNHRSLKSLFLTCQWGSVIIVYLTCEEFSQLISFLQLIITSKCSVSKACQSLRGICASSERSQCDRSPETVSLFSITHHASLTVWEGGGAPAAGRSRVLPPFISGLVFKHAFTMTQNSVTHSIWVHVLSYILAMLLVRRTRRTFQCGFISRYLKLQIKREKTEWMLKTNSTQPHKHVSVERLASSLLIQNVADTLSTCTVHVAIDSTAAENIHASLSHTGQYDVWDEGEE